MEALKEEVWCVRCGQQSKRKESLSKVHFITQETKTRKTVKISKTKATQTLQAVRGEIGAA